MPELILITIFICITLVIITAIIVESKYGVTTNGSNGRISLSPKVIKLVNKWYRQNNRKLEGPLDPRSIFSISKNKRLWIDTAKNHQKTIDKYVKQIRSVEKDHIVTMMELKELKRSGMNMLDGNYQITGTSECQGYQIQGTKELR